MPTSKLLGHSAALVWYGYWLQNSKRNIEGDRRASEELAGGDCGRDRRGARHRLLSLHDGARAAIERSAGADDHRRASLRRRRRDRDRDGDLRPCRAEGLTPSHLIGAVERDEGDLRVDRYLCTCAAEVEDVV